MRVSNSWCDYNIVTLLPWSIYVKLTVFMPVLSSTTSPFCKSIFFVMYTVWCHVLRPYCKFFIWINVSMFVIHVLTQVQHVLLVLIVYYSVVMIYLTRKTSNLQSVFGEYLSYIDIDRIVLCNRRLYFQLFVIMFG